MRRLVVLLLAVLALSVAAPAPAKPTVRETILQVFGPRYGPLALRVARCESRLRPRVVSPTRDVGVFQINYAAHRRPGESFASFRARYSDVRTNVRYAYRLSRRGTDFSAWRWSAHCWA